MDEDIAWVRSRAADIKYLVNLRIEWRADYVRAVLGQVEVVEPEEPHDRMFHCPAQCVPYGHFHFIKDKPGMV
jgi:hypothetical protein